MLIPKKKIRSRFFSVFHVPKMLLSVQKSVFDLKASWAVNFLFCSILFGNLFEKNLVFGVFTTNLYHENSIMKAVS